VRSYALDIRMTRFSTKLAATILGTILAAQAQSPRLPPPTYSFRLASRFFAQDSVIMQVDRDHDREVVVFAIAPTGFGAKPERKRVLFDFSTHQIYIQDDAGCRVIPNELENRAPAMMDPLSDPSTARLVESNPKVLRREMINGLLTRVVDYGDYRYWLLDEYDFPMRRAPMSSGRPLDVDIDISRLRFAAPQASLFAIPSDCKAMDTEPVADYWWKWRKPLKLEGKPLRLPLPTYSLELTSYMDEHPRTIQVDRDHEREAIEIRSQAKRQRILLDFVKHRVFVRDGAGAGCRETGYSPAQPPSDLDPTTGGAAVSLVDMRPKLLQWERVNGQLTRVFDVHDAGPGKIRLWLTQDYDFPLKEVAYQLDDQDRPTGSNKVFEVQQIQYFARAGVVFDPPAGCVAVEGEISEDFSNWDSFLNGAK
jgi:hypothetical protein